MAVCVIAGAAAMPALGAGRITLNDTGQQQCIGDEKTWSTKCAHSHQDADKGRDVHDPDPDDGRAGFSFRKVCRSGQMAGDGSCPSDPVLGNGPDDWGCTYDNVSQLTWEMKTADGEMHDGARKFSNKGITARDDPRDAAWLVDATNAEALCGAANWQLPDVHELHSIVAYRSPGMTGPLIDQDFFPNTWDNDTCCQSMTWTRDWSWYVNFSLGRIGTEQRDKQVGFVRLVQGQSEQPKHRYIPSADGTEVTDNLTGLVWRRCTEGMVWDGVRACRGTATAFKFKEATEYVRAHAKGGWRMPNIKELASIVDYVHGPTDSHAFPNTPGEPEFVSSTPMMWSGFIYVQIVGFNDGHVDPADAYHPTDAWLLRLVRRGRK